MTTTKLQKYDARLEMMIKEFIINKTSGNKRYVKTVATRNVLNKLSESKLLEKDYKLLDAFFGLMESNDITIDEIKESNVENIRKLVLNRYKYFSAEYDIEVDKFLKFFRDGESKKQKEVWTMNELRNFYRTCIIFQSKIECAEIFVPKSQRDELDKWISKMKKFLYKKDKV